MLEHKQAFDAYMRSGDDRIGRPIASAGAEVLLSAAILEWDALQTVRFGLAAPVVGRERSGAKSVTPYLAFGLLF